MAEQKAENRPPKFQSDDEEAAFWETHSPLDYPEHWVEDKDITIANPLVHTLAVRLDASTIDKLADIARKTGVGPSTLARMWLLERLSELGTVEQEEPT